MSGASIALILHAEQFISVLGIWGQWCMGSNCDHLVWRSALDEG